MAKLFMALLGLVQVFGLLAVILVGIWMGEFRGGFAWTENPRIEFNWHPLFMIIGLVFLYGNTVMVYRVFRNTKRKYIQILHAVMHLASLIFVSIALKTVFDSHDLVDPPIPNFYSLHSWLGITTVVFYILQWLVGLFVFFVPKVPLKVWLTYKPMHVYWGMIIFLMAIGTCLAGITERALFSVKNYSKYPPEGMLLNTLGIVLVAMGTVVSYIMVNPGLSRKRVFKKGGQRQSVMVEPSESSATTQE